jgi:feruloyl esterase
MTNTGRFFSAIAVSACLAALETPVGTQPPPARTAIAAGDCTVATLQTKSPQGTTITAAAMVKADRNLPEYCRVDGHASSPGNEVNFRLGLPVTWNGKFLFTGVGGLGGSIGSLNSGLARGYASASTDTGHVSTDPSWGENRAKEIDYGYRGTHVAAVATKALAAAFFSRQPEHAYFDGCSNGGRQAMMEVQRYPTDFDGIVAGDPATGTPMQVGRAIVSQHLLASTENYLSPEKVELLSRATLEACDATDGLKDGLISAPGLCSFKPETLKCAGGADGPACLTAGQVDTVKMIYAGLKLPNGETYTAGFPVGHEGGPTGWQAWMTGRTPATVQPDGTLAFTAQPPSGFSLSEQNMRFLALDTDDPGFNWRTLKFPADLPRLKTMSEILSPLDPDLRPYKSRNGRIIIYHGGSDPAISANGTAQYFEKMTRVVGGPKEAEAFARLYLVPGMHHCSGGPGPNSFDMLTALEAWVERGAAPAQIIASHSVNQKVDRTRPLCPYPQIARYSGSGSIDEAANFRCEAPSR